MEAASNSSIVIPAFNAEASIAAVVHEVVVQAGANAEILVMDDGSTDRTAASASDAGARCISSPHCGPASSRNHGARLSQREIVVFLDGDILPGPNWLKMIIQPFTDCTIAAVQGVTRTRQEGTVARYCQGEIEYKQQRFARSPSIDSIAAGMFAVRRELFLAYGGFSDRFRMAAAEDTDLSYRMSRDGYKIVFRPDAYGFHDQPASLRQYARLKFWRGYWRSVLYRRHPDKIMQDSYTLHTQRFQVAAALFAPAWVPAVAWSAGATGLGASLALVVATTLPSTWSIARAAGLRVGTIAPLMQGVAGISLALGLAAGGVREVVARRLAARRNSSGLVVGGTSEESNDKPDSATEMQATG